MRKHSIAFDEVAPEPPPQGVSRVVVPLGLAAVAAPFLYEGFMVCLGNWRTAMGRSSEVRTPVLDMTLDLAERFRDDLGGLIAPWFHRVPWQPTSVLMVAGLAMVLSMLMLKR